MPQLRSFGVTGVTPFKSEKRIGQVPHRPQFIHWFSVTVLPQASHFRTSLAGDAEQAAGANGCWTFSFLFIGFLVVVSRGSAVAQLFSFGDFAWMPYWASPFAADGSRYFEDATEDDIF